MQAKKLEKIVQNIETTFSQQKNPKKTVNINKSLIKKAQTLITKGPINLSNKTNPKHNIISKPATTMNLDKNMEKNINHKQNSSISSISKQSNRNISV